MDTREDAQRPERPLVIINMTVIQKVILSVVGTEIRTAILWYGFYFLLELLNVGDYIYQLLYSRSTTKGINARTRTTMKTRETM